MLRPTIVSSPGAAMRQIPSLWMLIVAQLDETAFDYSPADIAPLLNIAEHSLRHYCRELWPERPQRCGRWHFDFEDACVLIRRACIDPKNRPDRLALYNALTEAGIIDVGLSASPLIRRAEKAISTDHAERKQALRHQMRHTPPSQLAAA